MVVKNMKGTILQIDVNTVYKDGVYTLSHFLMLSNGERILIATVKLNIDLHSGAYLFGSKLRLLTRLWEMEQNG